MGCPSPTSGRWRGRETISKAKGFEFDLDQGEAEPSIFSQLIYDQNARARLYKQQSRRHMSENRRLCLSPNVPSSSSAQKGIVGYSNRGPEARRGLVPRGTPRSDEKAYNFARSLSIAPDVRKLGHKQYVTRTALISSPASCRNMSGTTPVNSASVHFQKPLMVVPGEISWRSPT